MTKDPYEVLGVSRDATDEEIKEAYRREAKKFHPDNYINSPLADLAKEKMQEVNDAYDTIQRQRRGEFDDSCGYNNGSYGSYSSSDPRFYEIRNLINSREFLKADELLEKIDRLYRNAEWFYLKGCIYLAKGWYFEAENDFAKAVQMDPSNNEYRSALNSLRSRQAGFNGRASSASGHTSGCTCDACDVCTGLMCADCCCECMGGDLIRCC